PGAPDDGLTLTGVSAYGFFMIPGTSAHLYFDEVAVFTPQAMFYVDQIANPPGEAEEAPLMVGFEKADVFVEEGETATITVTLNMTATYPVTVTYTTADGTATDGVDYTGVTGTLVFPSNTDTQSFTITTLEDEDEESDETVQLTLSDPVSVTLGDLDQATLTIQDDEGTDFCTRRWVTVDDFEDNQLPTGQYGDIDIGFVTWSDGSAVAITTTTVADSDPLAMEGQVGDNVVVKFDADISGWGGFSHLFMNDAGDTWVSQDWSDYTGIGFWLYGEGDGTGLFFEFKDNRAGSTTNDDAEIWTYPFTDDVAGWRYVEIPFGEFTRKEIGNGAPNDGMTLTEVHGWAFGSLGTGGAQTLYLDNVVLLERVKVVDDFESGLPSGTGSNGNSIGFVTWGSEIPTISNPTVPDTDTLALPCQRSANHLLQVDYDITGWGGGFSHAFEDATVSEWESQDWSTYEGLSLWLYGSNTGGNFRLDLFDNRSPGSTTDDAERFFYTIPDDFTGWQQLDIPFGDFARREDWQPSGAPDDGLTLTEVWGYGMDFPLGVGAQTAYLDNVLLYGDSRMPPLEVAFDAADYAVTEGDTVTLTVTLNYSVTTPVTVTYTTAESAATPHRDFTPVSGTLVIPANTLSEIFTVPTFEDAKHESDERIVALLFDPEGATLGFQRRAVLTIEDNDAADPYLLDDFEGFHRYAITGTATLSVTEIMAGGGMALPGQQYYENVLTIDYDSTGGPVDLTRTFSEGQDWSAHEGLSFWFYGTNSGEEVTVQLLDNQAETTAEVDPTNWVLAWSQEFDDAAGTAPDSNVWTHEIGDGALNDIIGWGNSELQYYTDSTDNAATDGAGNLQITISEVNTETTDLVCHYGPCEYTSARLISADKVEFAYGKIEARVKVPDGAGLWPAFWMLGTDIGDVGWPQCGEIDIMEYVGKAPNEVFGTLHGPGYSGGNGFGDIYDFGYPVADDYHTFTIEWAPDEIHWYVDGINFHNATPADVAPNEWVYNHPFYIILNLAIGGNFGGPVDPSLTFPREMLVDYVRVYQAEDTAERFETTFTDNFTGWRKIFVPFVDFTRSAEQPAGAPNDGLGLTEVWGYGLSMPNDSSGTFHVDYVSLYVSRFYMPLTFRH
ncbi:MAG: carbohydrate binding domain-containing protein, partial [Anaerolineae bacterium]